MLFVEAGSGADQHGQNATVQTNPALDHITPSLPVLVVSYVPKIFVTIWCTVHVYIYPQLSFHSCIG